MIEHFRIDIQVLCATETDIEVRKDDAQNMPMYNASLVVLNFIYSFSDSRTPKLTKYYMAWAESIWCISLNLSG